MSDHVAQNREAWRAFSERFVEPGRERWASNEPVWGTLDIVDDRVFPADVAGKDVVELGCGTGYVSSWFARRGARPIGLDLSDEQLASARGFQKEFGLAFPLVQGNAERTPFRDESFDVAFTEYGASIWCDPYAWIPEAARILRPGGELTFLLTSAIMIMCMPETDAEGPATDRMLRPYFDMHRFEWPDDPGVNFQLAHGDWIRLLRANGFEILDLVELRASPGAETTYPWVNAEWASRWPVEEAWKVRKR